MSKNKSARSWTRNLSRTKAFPEDVLIAGEDFEVPENHPLRDAKSDVREVVDRSFMLDLVDKGFLLTVRVVAHEVPGYDEPQMVALDGRRTIRHCRAANDYLVEHGSERRKVQVEVLPSGVNGSLAFDLARWSNMPSMSETHAQRIEYVRRYQADGSTDEHVCKRLGITVGQLRAYEDLGQVGTSPILREALDQGRIALTAAQLLARQDKETQARVLAKGGSIRVRDVQEAIGEAKGRSPRRARGPKEIKRVLESDEVSEQKLPDEVRAVLRWALGYEDALDDFEDLREKLEG